MKKKINFELIVVSTVVGTLLLIKLVTLFK